MTEINQDTKWGSTLRVAAAMIAFTLGSGVSAAAWWYSNRDAERQHIRRETEVMLKPYVTREELVSYLEKRDEKLIESISARVVWKLERIESGHVPSR